MALRRGAMIAAVEHRFERLLGTLLEPHAPRGAVWQACRDLYGLLGAVAGWAPANLGPERNARTALPAGEAIAPSEAAACLFEDARTQAFALGVVGAIEERRRAHPSRPVTVLYAGCGPFATLLLPALTRYAPDQLQVVLLDVHRASLAAVERVLTRLDAWAYVRRVDQADAARYRVPDGYIDLVVSECLRRGLSAEPQVAITWNLLSQLGPDVLMVPEEIRLWPVCGEIGDGTMGAVVPLTHLAAEPLFAVSAAAVRSWGRFDPAARGLPAGSLLLVDGIDPPDVIGLGTDIRVFAGVELGMQASPLTMPLALGIESPLPAGTSFDFEYRLDLPGLALAGPPAR